MEENADFEGDHGDDAIQRGNADQMRKPAERFDGGNQDEKQKEAEQAWARTGAASLFAVVAEIIAFGLRNRRNSGLSGRAREGSNIRNAAVAACSRSVRRASKTFLLFEKCLERVYRRSAVWAAAGFQPEIMP